MQQQRTHAPPNDEAVFINARRFYAFWIAKHKGENSRRGYAKALIQLSQAVNDS